MPYRHTLAWYPSLSRDDPAAGLHLVGTAKTFMFEPLVSPRRSDGWITIGRYTESSIHLPDLHASVRHAYVAQRADGTWEIADRKSRNGVVVDGNRIDAPTALTAGMHVRIGSTRFIAVNRHRRVPITACSVGEFCYLLRLVYGSPSEAARRMGRQEVQREFIRTRADSWRDARPGT